jgi:hypothetical protein
VIAKGRRTRPGNSIGKLNVKGDLLPNGATYLVELGANGAAQHSDVTGTAKLAGFNLTASNSRCHPAFREDTLL